ncbi:MAG: hypothetical protein KAT90_08200 [Gammaproteobacteria bacterium]|nr:hypothetical protein [Gammaproteobacteria bacterium]
MRQGWLLLFLPALVHAEDFSFDISNYEKKPYEWSGYLELSGEHIDLDQDSAFYNLSIPANESPDSFQRYSGTAELSGLYRFDNSSLNFRGQANTQDSYFGNQHDTSVHELYYTASDSDRLSFDVGKKVIKWGKGYAWNPVGFIERPKDPNDPALSREGFTLASVDYVRSFDGPLKTIAITPVILPVTNNLNEDFSSIEDTNFAAKLYMLYYDTDIDLMFLSKGSRAAQFGMDFSRNLTTNFEIHGELAHINNQSRVVIDSSNQLAIENQDAVNGLLGLRYLSEAEVTWIIEYYHNGTGYSESEMEKFFQLAKTNPAISPSLFTLAKNAQQSGYASPNPAKDYLYIRASGNEFIDIVYLAAGLTGMINLQDQSFSVTPELIYAGVQNQEARLRFIWLQGDRLSEFGEKLNDWRLEFRFRHFF